MMVLLVVVIAQVDAMVGAQAHATLGVMVIVT